jgi:iron(III) transport system ATP-binding protein
LSFSNWFRNKERSDEGDAAPPVGQRVRAAATIAARLTFEDVEQRYGDARALRGVSLDMAPGEVMGLVGPSGCGKTTLLRLAAGIEKPSAGRVLINRLEVSGPNRFVPPEQRSIGLMFQDFALFPHLTILANVAFGLNSLSRDDAKRTAMTTLKRVGLESYAAEYPHILSGGQQQRVALARAIAPRPSVLLMDEPFSGLDVQLREAMQSQTLELLREMRASCMIVTHDPEEAMRLSDRIAVMRSGLIVQVGTAEDLYRHPTDIFVARMFSEINEIAATVKSGRIDTPFGIFPIKNIGEGKTVILCVRQRGVRLTEAGTGRAARVLHTKFLGDAAILEVGVDGLDDTFKVRMRESEAPLKGTEVSVIVDASRVLIFPATNDERKNEGSIKA